MKLVDIGETWDKTMAIPAGKAKEEKHYPGISLKSSKFKALKDLEVGKEVEVMVVLHKTGSREITREGQDKEDEMTFDVIKVGAPSMEEMSDEDLDKKIDHAMHVKN